MVVKCHIYDNANVIMYLQTINIFFTGPLIFYKYDKADSKPSSQIENCQTFCDMLRKVTIYLKAYKFSLIKSMTFVSQVIHVWFLKFRNVVKFKDLYGEFYSLSLCVYSWYLIHLYDHFLSLKQNGTRLDAFPGEQFTLCRWNSGGWAGHFWLSSL